MLQAGSLHQFLMKLHKEFGDIASFYFGRQHCVSICSPELFHEHQGVFDRPPELFTSFEPLFGAKSITYANKTEGKTRRNQYDRALSHKSITHYYGKFQEIADAFIEKLSSLERGEHIPLQQQMLEYALNIVLRTLYDNKFTEEEISEFRRSHSVCWSLIDKSVTGIGTVEDDVRQNFDEALVIIHKIIKHAIRQRKDNPPGADEEILLDILIESAADEETLLADAITFAVGGFHNTGNLLTWCFYYLATHQEIQDKVFNEIKTKLGQEDVDHSNVDSLLYTKQVLDETLRCSILAPWVARFQDIDSELGGHKIPKNTPVFHALGVSLHNERFWPEPQRFDPDRFSEQKVKSRPRLAFTPFGFAGRRPCPGYRFAYADSMVLLVSLLKKFKVMIVDGQEVTPIYGFITRPKDEILIKIEKR